MIKSLHRNWVPAAGFFLLNIIIKVIFIDNRDIAMDEPFSIWWAQHDLKDILTMLKTENNPILHFLLLHFWIKIFGISAMSVRMPSVIFSALTAVVVILAGARSFGRKTGIFAALIYSLSTMQVYFAHEARVYAMFEFFAACNLYLCLAIIRNPKHRSLFVWLFICDLLLVYSHYFGWVVVGVQLLVLLLLPVRQQIWKPLIFVSVLLMLCYIPNIFIFIDRFFISSGGTWVPKPKFTELYGNINRFLNSRYVTLTILLFATASLLLIIVKRRMAQLVKNIKSDSFYVVLLWFAVPYCAMFAISYIVPVFLDRYILFTSVGLYLLIAVCFDVLPLPDWAKSSYLLIIPVFMLVFFNLNPDHKRKVKVLSDIVRLEKSENNIVMISPEYSYLEFVYHYDIKAFRDYNNTLLRMNDSGIFAVRTTNDLPAKLIDSVKHVIYVDCGAVFAFGEDITGNELRLHFTKVDSIYSDDVYQVHKFYQTGDMSEVGRKRL